MSSSNPKKASNHLPYCEDQGLPYLVGAGKAGLAIQQLRLHAMPADGIVKFVENGLMEMADGLYTVFIHNHSDVADEATVASNVRLANQITITGPDTGDLLDIMICGRLKDQTAAA